MKKSIFEKIIAKKSTFSSEEISIINSYISSSIIEERDGKYTLNSKYKIGKISIQNNRTKFIDKNSLQFNISQDHLRGAYDEDIVLVQMIFNPRSNSKAKVIEILTKNKKQILCYFKDKEFYSIKDDTKISLNINHDLNQNDVVLVEKSKIKKVLGNIKDPNIDEIISLSLYEEEYREQNDYSYLDKVKISNENRKDLTSLPFCTIDPSSAKDHDDAIYYDYKNKILYVAIADVSSFVKEGSFLDKEALKRSFSIYLPNKVLPMLPSSLSDNICSLRQNEKRLALVCEMNLDTTKLKVKKSKFYEAIIECKHKYSYEEAKKIIDINDENKKDLLILNKVMTKFRTKRLLDGFDFRSQKISLSLGKNGKINKTNKEQSNLSHKLVEQCMLLANCEAAKSIKGIGIYRTHDEPDYKKLDKLVQSISLLGIKIKNTNDVFKTIRAIQNKASHTNMELQINELIIQAQQQAKYTTKATGHFGLGFDDYSHFTSPIRRYSDLILHRILKSKKIPKNIEELCEKISIQERKIANLVWDFEDRKFARWANENINKNFDAIVVDSKNSIVKLDDKIKGARIICENYSGQMLFSKVKIKIKSSDILTKKIKGIIL